MSTPARILLALSQKPMTAYDLSAQLGISTTQVRSAMQELLNRVLAVPVSKRIKTYGLTTLGQMEADRLKGLGMEARTKTPKEAEASNDAMVANAQVNQPALAMAWRAA